MKTQTVLAALAFAAVTLIASHLALSQAASVTSTLQSSLSAQSGSVPVQDVTLTGLVTSGPESDTHTDPFTFRANATGGSRAEIDFSEGPLVTIRNTTTTGHVGWWSRNGGTSHTMAGHNMLSDAAWYFPSFIVQRLIQDKTTVVSYMGTNAGLAHFQIHGAALGNLPQSAAEQIAHLTEMDLYLDPGTLLPIRLDFNIHPDNNALVDIPISVHYSGYQTVNGVTVPMHIERFLNHLREYDLQVQSVAINTGLNQSEFSAQ